MKNIFYISMSISFLSLSLFVCLYLNTLRTTQGQLLDTLSEAHQQTTDNTEVTLDLMKNVGIFSLAVGLEQGEVISKKEANKKKKEALENLENVHPIIVDALDGFEDLLEESFYYY